MVNQLSPVTLRQHSLDGAVLTKRHFDDASQLHVDLAKLEEVTRLLRDPTMTLLGARRAFDTIVIDFPQLRTRLSPTATIVNNPALEMGIVKLFSTIHGHKRTG
ncbi:hypothetical protein P43SY_010991 [Pythium insidiosum]|uniref:Uncharacterized protein n=1 Tax=Pythium insidiosum TaxID=114742 RepID=A0AAD5L5M8_PYTIN|nr:hypothetical protein P43SY_010991 [Pythium insidiosum]